MLATPFCRISPQPTYPFKLRLPLGEITLEHNPHGIILDALSEQPLTLADLLAKPEIGQLGTHATFQALVLAVAARLAAPALAPDGLAERQECTGQLNRAVLSELGAEREEQTLASPILGTGVPVPRVDQVFLAMRPSAPQDQRTASTYIFGAICPGDGKGAALVLPACNTEAMNLHLAEIAAEVAPGKHAALVVDQAGWHLSAGLVVPDNITLVVLPPKCPELNPAENVWQFMRDNWLSNRVFASYTDLVDHCCEAWNKLIERPWTIMSIGLRDWANGF